MNTTERLQTVTAVADALNKRGHPAALIDTQLNTVDGTWVGVWIMPKPVKKKEIKYVLRIGFSETVEEHDLNLGPEVLADKVLAWLSLHGEASRTRSTAKVNDNGPLLESSAE